MAGQRNGFGVRNRPVSDIVKQIYPKVSEITFGHAL